MLVDAHKPLIFIIAIEHQLIVEIAFPEFREDAFRGNPFTVFIRGHVDMWVDNVVVFFRVFFHSIRRHLRACRSKSGEKNCVMYPR